MPKKKSKANQELPEHSAPCQAPGCRETGQYKAPKSKSALHEYAWYCLDHIRDYNRQWDFFSGMSRDEIEKFMRDAVTGHRPTWSREEQVHKEYDRLQEALDEFLHLSPRKAVKSPSLTPRLREALAIMDMEYPFTLAALKARWRALARKLHPDVNKSDRKAEEKFKRLTVAYLLLTEHIKIADGEV